MRIEGLIVSLTHLISIYCVYFVRSTVCALGHLSATHSVLRLYARSFKIPVGGGGNVDSLLRRIRSNLLDCLNYRLHFKHRSDFHGEMEKYFWSACAEKPFLLI